MSAVLTVAGLVSYFGFASITRRRDDASAGRFQACTLAASRGRIQVVWESVPLRFPTWGYSNPWSVPRGWSGEASWQPRGFRAGGAVYPAYDLMLPGFSVRAFSQGPAQDASVLREVVVSIWAFVGLLLVPAILLWRSELRRRRAAAMLRAGRCPRCGYDLRGSPGRCPECGRSRSEVRKGDR